MASDAETYHTDTRSGSARGCVIVHVCMGPSREFLCSVLASLLLTRHGVLRIGSDVRGRSVRAS